MKLETIFVDEVPEEKEPGKLYVSEKYQGCTHACPCGCGTQCYIPFIPGDASKEHCWGYTNHGDGTVTLEPSILRRGCRAHYYIRRSEIQEFRVEK